jgi:hypothetical protein
VDPLCVVLPSDFEGELVSEERVGEADVLVAAELAPLDWEVALASRLFVADDVPVPPSELVGLESEPLEAPAVEVEPL